jgi:Arc/MetJ-type ribon-helix-helix transcriptional regulator
MANVKRKAVVSADVGDLTEVEELVRKGHYRTVSEFVREAMRERLRQLRRDGLARQVARYCDEVAPGEDAELIAWQAFDTGEKTRRRRAPR